MHDCKNTKNCTHKHFKKKYTNEKLYNLLILKMRAYIVLVVVIYLNQKLFYLFYVANFE